MIKRLSVLGLGVLAIVSTAMWVTSTVSGAGLLWLEHAPTRGPGRASRSRTVRLDLAVGQLIAEYETIEPSPFGDRSDSQWYFHTYGGSLSRGYAIGGGCANCAWYTPTFSRLPKYTHTVVSNATNTWVSVPLYLPTLLLAPYPLIAFIRGPLRRQRHRRRGRCLTCGYDLTGNTSGRCPECGKLIA